SRQRRGLRGGRRWVGNAAGSPEGAGEAAPRLRLGGRRFLKLEPELWGYVPFDAAIPRAVRRQEPVVSAFPRSPAAVAYRALAARLWASSTGPLSPQPSLVEKLEA